MPRDNRLPSYESMLEFQEVYLRAVALSWKDPAFRQALLHNPEQALADYFAYRCPWNVVLKVREASGDGQGWDKEARRWKLPPVRTTFGLPAAPAIDEQLVAFAAYNDAGPTYLFTCC